MDEDNEKKLPWGIFEALAIFFIFLVFTVFSPEIKLIVENILGHFTDQVSLIETFLVLSLVQFSIFIGYIYLILKVRYKMDFKVFFAKSYQFEEIIKYGLSSSVILFLAAILVMVIMALMFPSIGEAQDITNIFAYAETKWEIFLVFIVAVVLAPISEELYFRGFLYKALRNKFSQGVAIASASIVFGAVHFDLYRFVLFFIAGVILSHIYEKYDNILIPMIAHGTWNGIMVLIFFSTVGS